ncbi:hypothetical protein [Myroides odoratimimus]|uniref:hypothetical protein n=1 Tax=Myroides odoratimimus TaxID=76832 RepID=UPI0031018808
MDPIQILASKPLRKTDSKIFNQEIKYKTNQQVEIDLKNISQTTFFPYAFNQKNALKEG